MQGTDLELKIHIKLLGKDPSSFQRFNYFEKFDLRRRRTRLLTHPLAAHILGSIHVQSGNALNCTRILVDSAAKGIDSWHQGAKPESIETIFCCELIALESLHLHNLIRIGVYCVHISSATMTETSNGMQLSSASFFLENHVNPPHTWQPFLAVQTMSNSAYYERAGSEEVTFLHDRCALHHGPVRGHGNAGNTKVQEIPSPYCSPHSWRCAKECLLEQMSRPLLPLFLPLSLLLVLLLLLLLLASPMVQCCCAVVAVDADGCQALLVVSHHHPGT